MLFQKETEFVKHLMHELQAAGHIVLAINAPDYRAFGQRGKRKGRGQQGLNPYVPGSPDLVICERMTGKFVGIEAKMPEGELNENQRGMKRLFETYGFTKNYLVVRPDDYRLILISAGLIR
jgi:hypothetical protein